MFCRVPPRLRLGCRWGFPALYKGGQTVTGVGVETVNPSFPAGLSLESAAALREVQLAGGAVILVETAEFSGSPEEVVRAVAGGHVQVFAPESGSWTVEELASGVLKEAGLSSPWELSSLCIQDADRMSGAASDRLLKMLEEPAAGVMFWLFVEREEQLSATIRGRCTEVVRPKDASGEQVLEVLVGAGATVEEVEFLLKCSRGNTVLAQKLWDGRLLVQAKTLLLFDPWASPTALAVDEFLAVFCSAVVGKAVPSSAAAWSTMTTEQRSQVRFLLLKWFSDDVALPVDSSTFSPSIADDRLRKLARMHGLLRANLPPLHALSALL